MTAEVACRPMELTLGISTSVAPFSMGLSFRDLADPPLQLRLEKLRDTTMRDRILNEPISLELLAIMPPLHQQLTTRWDRLYLLGDAPDYEPVDGRSVAAMTVKAGKGSIGLRLVGN